MKLQTFKENNTTYQYIHTNQFKSRILTIRFFTDLNSENITARNLMLSMLRAKNRVTPTRKAQSKYLESLYDSLLLTQALKFGTKHINQITMVMIDDRFTIEKTLFHEALTFLKHVLYEPLFDEKTLEEEKQFLKDYFKAEFANKTRFASKRYNQYLMEEHPYNQNAFGKEEAIDLVTLDMIKDSYNQMLNENEVFISVVGNFDEQKIHHEILTSLPIKSVVKPLPILYRHEFIKKDRIFEAYDVTQNRIFITLKTGIFYRDEDYFTMLVLNALLGEGSDSLLFKTVREHHSLAYYVYSSYSPFNGLITMASGMDEKNIEKGKAMMLSCLALIQNGSFSDEDLTLAKTHLITGFKQSYDSQGSLSQKALRAALFNLPFNEESVLSNIANVTKEALTRVANQCHQIFEYELGGIKHENETL
jgi:predicted Zn-dependent peptidase